MIFLKIAVAVVVRILEGFMGEVAEILLLPGIGQTVAVGVAGSNGADGGYVAVGIVLVADGGVVAACACGQLIEVVIAEGACGAEGGVRVAVSRVAIIQPLFFIEADLLVFM